MGNASQPPAPFNGSDPNFSPVNANNIQQAVQSAQGNPMAAWSLPMRALVGMLQNPQGGGGMPPQSTPMGNIANRMLSAPGQTMPQPSRLQGFVPPNPMPPQAPSLPPDSQNMMPPQTTPVQPNGTTVPGAFNQIAQRLQQQQPQQQPYGLNGGWSY